MGDQGWLDTADSYDPLTDSWSSLPPMQVARADHGTCTLGRDGLVVRGPLRRPF
jgi:hypothetical protein